MDITQFYQAFFEEADELLAEMELLLLGLDLEAPDSEHLNAIFRAAHSIKGGAATFGFTALTDTTHLLENLLDRARHGDLKLTTRMMDAFLETKDVLQKQMGAYRTGGEPEPEMVAHICAVLRQLALESSQGGAAAQATMTPVAPPASAAKAPEALPPAAAPQVLWQQRQAARRASSWPVRQHRPGWTPAPVAAARHRYAQPSRAQAHRRCGMHPFVFATRPWSPEKHPSFGLSASSPRGGLDQAGSPAGAWCRSRP